MHLCDILVYIHTKPPLALSQHIDGEILPSPSTSG